MPARIFFVIYACSVVYFTFFTIAILTALNSVACRPTFVTCFSINIYSIYSNCVDDVQETARLIPDDENGGEAVEGEPQQPVVEQREKDPPRGGDAGQTGVEPAEAEASVRRSLTRFTSRSKNCASAAEPALPPVAPTFSTRCTTNAKDESDLS